jgi:phosphoribosylanthranilate isomerase
MTRIKICGITNLTQAIAANSAGADYIGLVFAPSRRQITPEKAREIINTLHRLACSLITVGVFVNSSAKEVNEIAESCQLDWVQLSGDEDWDFCRHINRPVIKAFHISTRTTARDVMKQIEDGYSRMSKESLICLLDAHVKGAYGGTGQVFNWQVAEEVSRQVPIIAAGGLTPENIDQLLQRVKPWGVDVSSGVETAGCKDILKITDFITKVRNGEK